MDGQAVLKLAADTAGFDKAKLSIVGVATALVGLAVQAMNFSDKMDEMSDKIRISSERLSLLHETAKISDTSLQALIAGSEKLALRMSKQDEESGKVNAAIKELDVSQKDANGTQKSALQIQEDIIVASANMTDAHKGETLGVQALGAAYYELRSGVLQVKEKKSEMYDLMSKTGAIVTKQAAKDAGDLKDELSKLGTVLGGIGQSIWSVAAPALVWLAKKFTQVGAEFAALVARITGTEAKSVSGGRENNQLEDTLKKTEESLERFKERTKGLRRNSEEQAEDQRHIAAVEKRIGGLKSQLELQKMVTAEAKKQENHEKNLALDGAPGEGIKAGSGFANKDKKEKKEKEEHRLTDAQIYTKQMEALKEFGESQMELQKQEAKWAEEDKKIVDKAVEDGMRIEARNARIADSILDQIEPNHRIIGQIEEINRLEGTRWMTTEQADKARAALNLKIISEQDTFIAGWENAFRKYEENAKHSAKLGETVFNSSTKNMEDAIFKFATTGKLSFSDLTASILKDIARQQSAAAASGIMNLLTKAIISGFSAYSGTSNVPTAANYENQMDRGVSWHKMATGTNNVPYDEFPALLHKGEAVVPKEYNPALGGKGGGGGLVMGDINITVQGGNTNEETGSALSAEMVRTVKALARGEMFNERRPGGILYGV